MDLLPNEILLHINKYLDEHNKKKLCVVNHHFNSLIMTTSSLFNAIINHENINLEQYKLILDTVEEIFFVGRKIKITIGSIAKIIADVCNNNLFDDYFYDDSEWLSDVQEGSEILSDGLPLDNILIWAVRTDRKNITLLLIESCKNFSKIKNQIICLAINDGTLSMLKFLIEMINFFQFTDSNLIKLAIMQASLSDNLMALEYLFQFGEKNNNYSKPLKEVIKQGYVDIFNFFVDNGCLANADKNILKVADEYKRSTMVKILIDNVAFANIDDVMLFNIAIRQGFLDIVEKMINNGYPVHTEKDKILNVAIVENNENVVEYLLNKYY